MLLLSSFKDISSYSEGTDSGPKADSTQTPSKQLSGTPSGPKSSSTLLGTHLEDTQTAYLVSLHKLNLWSLNQLLNPTFQTPSNLGPLLSLNEYDPQEATEYLKATKNWRKRKPMKKLMTPSPNPKKKAKSFSTNQDHRPQNTKEQTSLFQCHQQHPPQEPRLKADNQRAEPCKASNL